MVILKKPKDNAVKKLTLCPIMIMLWKTVGLKTSEMLKIIGHFKKNFQNLIKFDNTISHIKHNNTKSC